MGSKNWISGLNEHGLQVFAKYGLHGRKREGFMTVSLLLAVTLSIAVLLLACTGEVVDTPSHTPIPSPTEPAKDDESLRPQDSSDLTLEGGDIESTEDSLERSYSRRTPFVPLDDPVLLDSSDAAYLGDNDLILGLSWNGTSRAYPIRMLTFHHIVNDTIDGKPFLITF